MGFYPSALRTEILERDLRFHTANAVITRQQITLVVNDAREPTGIRLIINKVWCIIACDRKELELRLGSCIAEAIEFQYEFDKNRLELEHRVRSVEVDRSPRLDPSRRLARPHPQDVVEEIFLQLHVHADLKHAATATPCYRPRGHLAHRAHRKVRR